MTDSPKPVNRRRQRLETPRAKRIARAKRRETLLESLACGLDRVTIARTLGVSTKTVAREIDRALDERQPLSTDRFLRLQTERLQRALGAVEEALKTGDMRAAAVLLAMLEKLDRYHGLQRSAAEPAFSPPVAPARLAPPRADEAPIPLTPERTRIDV